MDHAWKLNVGERTDPGMARRTQRDGAIWTRRRDEHPTEKIADRGHSTDVRSRNDAVTCGSMAMAWEVLQ